MPVIAEFGGVYTHSAVRWNLPFIHRNCCTGPSLELTGQSTEPRHGSCEGAVAEDEPEDLGHHTPGFGESVIGGRIAE
ncbi:hypothetical protein PP1Y_Lpl1269 (plasmid) [Novosphingobium sp. PP1Y]|nr:hypothetical protein PP1Y_Lpl1269 [Novosphingobium sp. PP1Y]